MNINQNPKKILVTGATGNVGRHLISQLLSTGHKVSALTRTPDRANLPSEAELILGNLTDTQSLLTAFEGVDAVYLISFNGEDFSPLTNGVKIMELARKSGVKKVIILKSEMGKSALDEAVETSGITWTKLLPVEFMSNTLEWAASINREDVVREAFPDAKSAMIHEADIAAVALEALTKDGHAGKEYWLTGAEALTITDRVNVLSAVLGREIRYIELSKEETVRKWQEQYYSEEDIAFFLKMRTNPPEVGYTILPTVEQVTGKPPRSFARWVAEHAAVFEREQ
ncbi:NAD(P)H-binding protein [Pedobacter caeni]|uniref:Uncharacterized conserved protein YbjT, contains NAD(P)-binding and DUF2867 domains n=1 Tax=Pedobacter caeni TaxID=288992 RepID=A0A1M4V2N2_9SPHI|nr:NAD(P)H-binding protein [Pedobacter caeni]SHE63251.1 Uncharacterized conserved protein YbjT, contains NAD(P)-binding and DUF2867 domains [Pedobacter caeni]